MKIFESINKKFGYVKKSTAKRYGRQTYARGFEAAKVDRLTSKWLTQAENIEEEIESKGMRLTARARDAVNNNDYARAWLSRNLINVVGPFGFQLQNKAKDLLGKLDKQTNDLIEDKWKEWQDKKYCTMSGDKSFYQLLRIIYTYKKVEGEYFLRKIRPLRRETNKFGFSLEIIDPADVDLTKNEELGNGNIVVMGVEFNKWRKPVAYYIRERTAKNENHPSYYRERKLIRVDASEIIHGYNQEYVKQSRGYSDLSPSLMRIHMLKGWEDASIVNARSSAAKMGFLYRKDVGAEYHGDDTDSDGNIISEFEPGTIEQLPVGMEFGSWDPKFPHEQHGPFLETQLRAFAAGQGQNYNLLTGDLAGASYSALKAGRTSENDNWIVEQNLLIEDIKEIFNEWLMHAMMNREIDIPFNRFAEVNKPQFYGRSWKQLEPYKEANAAKLKREMGWISDQEIVGEDGKDLEEVYEKIAEAEELKKTLGLDFAPKEKEQNNGDVKDVKDEDDEDEENSDTDKEKEKRYLKIINNR